MALQSHQRGISANKDNGFNHKFDLFYNILQLTDVYKELQEHKLNETELRKYI